MTSKNKLFDFDKKINTKFLIGTDEAGRGPGAGGVFASAVYFKSMNNDLIEKLNLLNDSKKLSKKTREYLFEIILENTINSTVCIEVEEIEKINILNASLKAMKLACENVIQQIYQQEAKAAPPAVHCSQFTVLVDGNKLIKQFEYPQNFLIKGDAKSASIAAASILAKVSRDFYMQELDKKFPQYNWKKNAGYLTREHLHAIDIFGTCPVHRMSFLRKHFERKNIVAEGATATKKHSAKKEGERMQFSAIEFVPKIEIDCLEVLSLVYTPGVGHACLKIHEDVKNSFIYTNRSNSVAVISFDWEKSLKRAVFLKNTLNIDAYPFEVAKDGIKLVVENIYPNFCGIDLTLIAEEVKNIDFKIPIPVMKVSGANIEEFFKPVSKNIFMFDITKLKGDPKEQALYLREKAGGVVETRLSNEPQKKPIAILSDGSAVLGFGNIGAEAGLPVMEGKAVIFKALGGVNAIPLCVKTQKPQEIIKIAQYLQNSFSGINLEDISAPRCFDVENKLIETLDIPVFHDDQHGTAIVVLAALLNALSVVKKEISKIKIVISGAGAAAQAVSKLIMQAGATNITHADKDGIVRKNRKENDLYLEKLADVTNKANLKGNLNDALESADVFIGLSAADVLKPEFIKKMKKKPIIFALANPTPEIMPDVAKKAGAFIIATGRSDFKNQINNSLAFPGLFRGILEHKIKKITDKIQLECAIAIASLIKDEDLSPKNILPNALDPRVVGVIVNRLRMT